MAQDGWSKKTVEGGDKLINFTVLLPDNKALFSHVEATAGASLTAAKMTEVCSDVLPTQCLPPAFLLTLLTCPSDH